MLERCPFGSSAPEVRPEAGIFSSFEGVVGSLSDFGCHSFNGVAHRATEDNLRISLRQPSSADEEMADAPPD
jgi:hypothetical protein